MVPNSVSYYRSASYSHVGMVRKVNEDASLDAPEAGLWVVADGMGGHAAGDFVSSLIVDTLRRIPAASSLPAYVGALRTGLAQVNERVRQEAGLRGVSVMGSTLVRNWNCRKPRCTCCPATASCSAATASTRPPTTANCATCSATAIPMRWSAAWSTWA